MIIIDNEHKCCKERFNDNPKIFDYSKICLTDRCRYYRPPKREKDKNDQILISHLEESEEETFTQRSNWEKLKKYMYFGGRLVCWFSPVISSVVGPTISKVCFVMESAEMAKLFNSVKEDRTIW